MKVALFDVDKVMILRKDDFSTIYSEKFNVPAERLIPFFKGPFKKCLVGKADIKEELRPFLGKWEWKGSAEDFLDLWFGLERNVNYDLAGEIMKLRNKGILCFLASNQEKYRASYVINDMGFKDIFDGFFVSHDLGVTKFEQEFFELLYEKLNSELGVEKKDIVLWDDKERIINVAKRFGITGFVYRDFEGFKKDLDSILSDLR